MMAMSEAVGLSSPQKLVVQTSSHEVALRSSIVIGDTLQKAAALVSGMELSETLEAILWMKEYRWLPVLSWATLLLVQLTIGSGSWFGVILSVIFGCMFLGVMGFVVHFLCSVYDTCQSVLDLDINPLLTTPEILDTLLRKAAVEKAMVFSFLVEELYRFRGSKEQTTNVICEKDAHYTTTKKPFQFRWPEIMLIVMALGVAGIAPLVFSSNSSTFVNLSVTLSIGCLMMVVCHLAISDMLSRLTRAADLALATVQLFELPEKIQVAHTRDWHRGNQFVWPHPHLRSFNCKIVNDSETWNNEVAAACSSVIKAIVYGGNELSDEERFDLFACPFGNHHSTLEIRHDDGSVSTVELVLMCVQETGLSKHAWVVKQKKLTFSFLEHADSGLWRCNVEMELVLHGKLQLSESSNTKRRGSLNKKLMKPVKVMQRTITVDTNLGVANAACGLLLDKLNRLTEQALLGIRLPKFTAFIRPTRAQMVPGSLRHELVTPPASPTPSTPTFERNTWSVDSDCGRRQIALLATPMSRTSSIDAITEEADPRCDSPEMLPSPMIPKSPDKDTWLAQLE